MAIGERSGEKRDFKLHRRSGHLFSSYFLLPNWKRRREDARRRERSRKLVVRTRAIEWPATAAAAEAAAKVALNGLQKKGMLLLAAVVVSQLLY